MIEFYFDCSSPWTHLGFHSIQPLAQNSARRSTVPILVGGVFTTVNPSVYAWRGKAGAGEGRLHAQGPGDWARVGAGDQDAAERLPVNSVKAMRGCIWLAPG